MKKVARTNVGYWTRFIKRKAKKLLAIPVKKLPLLHAALAVRAKGGEGGGREKGKWN
jgi:hypothetical protein